MTKYTATIRLKDKPYNQIMWFTKNFDKEIGALGIGQVKNGEIIVDKLCFPNQIVNGAHVHFKPEDWEPVMKELTEDEIGKIIFYWHKHPGSAGASQGDEDDTFDAFMDENAGRKIFGFLQTAKKHNGDIDMEARIEMRKPIWTSIDAEITTDEDITTEKECREIIKNKITLGNAGAHNQPGTSKVVTTNTTGAYSKCTRCGEWEMSCKDGICFMCRRVENYTKPTTQEVIPAADGTSMYEVSKGSGCVRIYAEEPVKEWIEAITDSEDVLPLRGNCVMKPYNKGTLFIIQPKSGKLEELYQFFKDLEMEMYGIDEPFVKDMGDKDTDEYNRQFNNPNFGCGFKSGIQDYVG